MNHRTQEGAVVIDEGKPLFVQIAEGIEDQIVDGTLEEETRAPSTNELAAFFRINPATAAKGVNMLVDHGILYKQRGIGMFVADGAREQVLASRRAAFADRYLAPLIAEARTLGLGPDDVVQLIREHAAPDRETDAGATAPDAAARTPQPPPVGR